MSSDAGSKPKKRKRSTTPTTKESTKKKSIKSASAPVPTNVLLIDNGGDTLKYGILGLHKNPESMPNITARLRHQLTVLVGDEIHSVQPTQLVNTTRSLERGCITNLGNQVQVWKRVLEKLRIQVPVRTEAAEAFGWKLSRQTANKKAPLYFPQQMAVVIMVCPLCPRSIMEQVISIWFNDFGFSHVGLLTTSAFGAVPTSTECCCVVDMGWSATQVVPTYQQKIIGPIRRQPLGSRHLVGLWKYYCSYRQWNLMDAEFLMKDVHRLLAYVALDLRGELDTAQRTILGKRPFDREFVLPDYQTIARGFVRLTPWLKRIEEEKQQQKKEEKQRKKDAEDVVSDDADIRKTKKESLDEDRGEGVDKDDNTTDIDAEKSDEDVDSEDETDDQRRKRLLKLKAEEERRQREIEAERQTLMVSVERFTIPEVIFQPSDAGLEKKMASLPRVIVSAIELCPSIYQSALYETIRIVGGACLLPNLKERLYRELRQLAPTNCDLKLDFASDPVNDAWINAQSWLEETSFDQWSLSRDDFEGLLVSNRSNKACHKLLEREHGRII